MSPIFTAMNLPLKQFKSAGILFAIVFGVLYFRRTDAFTYPQLWAEDGSVFFKQFDQSGIESLILPYAGYLHFVPRLVAILWGLLGIGYEYIPFCYNMSALFITFLVVLYLWVGAGSLNIKHRYAYALLFLFLPVWPDVFMTITNINWITGLILVHFLLAGWPYEKGWMYYAHLGLLLIVSLTGPFSVVFTPVVLLILFRERRVLTLRKIVPFAIILLSGVVQGIYIKFIDTNVVRGFPGVKEDFHLLRLITNNIDGLFLINRFPGLGDSSRFVVCIFISAVLLVALIVCYRAISDSRKYVLPIVALLLLGAFIASYWPNESKIVALFNARYYFIPYTCIGWVLLLALDNVITKWDVFIFAGFILLQRNNTKFSLGDKHWKKQVKEYRDGQRTEFEIQPDDWRFSIDKKTKEH